MICRAVGCDRWAVPGYPLCDPHLERAEAGERLEVKPETPRVKFKRMTPAERLADEERRRLRVIEESKKRKAKRQGKP